MISTKESGLILTMDEIVSHHPENELLALLEIGDVITIRGDVYTIISAGNEHNTIWLKPHTGYLGDRTFPINVVTSSLTEEFIVGRRLKKLNIE